MIVKQIIKMKIFLFLLKFDCRFLQNLNGHNAPINAMALNDDGVLVSGGDNGSLQFWDYESGYCFQKSNTIVQPGKKNFT